MSQMRNLTPEEIQEVYRLLETMKVPIDDRHDRGLPYIRDRLMLCRAMQDALQDLRLKVGRALSYVTEQRIYQKNLLFLADTDQAKTQSRERLVEMEQHMATHTLLYRLIGAQGSVLSQTNRDIKLLGDVMLKQMKYAGEGGGIDPNEAPELLQPADLAQIGGPVDETGVVDVASAAADYFADSDAAQMAAQTVAKVVAETAPPAGADHDTLMGAPVSELAGLFGTGAVQASGTAPVQAAAIGAVVTLVTPAPLVPAGPIETVGFDAALPEAVTAERLRVPELNATPIEFLFEENVLNGHNGATGGATATLADRAF